MAEKGYVQYMQALDKLLKKIQETQSANIEKGAELIASSIVKGGVLHVYGAGHSNCIAEEIFFRAGTLVPINQIVDISLAGSVGVWKSAFMERLEGVGLILYNHTHAKPEDVFLVISNSGRNAAPIEMAREAKAHGHKVIAETCSEFSMSQPSRHSSGKRLLDYADVILDNQGPWGDVVLKRDDMVQGLGPASGVTGIYLIHAMLVEAAFLVKEKGMEPPVFMYGNLDGGMEFNQKMLDHYWTRIRNW